MKLNGLSTDFTPCCSLQSESVKPSSLYCGRKHVLKTTTLRTRTHAHVCVCVCVCVREREREREKEREGGKREGERGRKEGEGTLETKGRLLAGEGGGVATCRVSY